MCCVPDASFGLGTYRHMKGIKILVLWELISVIITNASIYFNPTDFTAILADMLVTVQASLLVSVLLL